VNIFGVNGKTEVVDTTSGDAAAGDVMQGRVAWVDGVAVTGSIATCALSPTSAVVPAGYYAATNLTQADADLAPGSIRAGVSIFGVTGTVYVIVARSGQTNTFQTGDDWYYRKGIQWPLPRFVVQVDTNVVLDALTGLMWARNANLGGSKSWSSAIDYCEALDYGGHTDWRLPNRRELMSLVSDGAFNPPLLADHPFNNVVGSFYWTGTSCFFDSTSAWIVSLYNGISDNKSKASSYYVWPVRGGQ